jgi:hypothetical protein
VGPNSARNPNLNYSVPFSGDGAVIRPAIMMYSLRAILSIEPFSSRSNGPTQRQTGQRRIDAASPRLPLRSDGALSNEGIRCEQNAIVLDGLAD